MISTLHRIDEAFQNVARAEFLPPNERDYAEIDRPLPIGHGQTNSQPSTVRRMLRWLDIQPGDKILDVGSGSGWTAALMAHITGLFGHVYAVERVPELLMFGKQNCEKLAVTNVQFFRAGHTYGLPKYAPYDRILVSAEATEVPADLLNQLELYGKMIIPVNSEILEITKLSEHEIETNVHPGFAFVPLVK